MNMLLTPLLFIIRICVQTIFLALGQIWANKTRSVLTCLGIIFGVAAVISVVGLLGGMKGFVLKEFESIGARKMWVWGYVPVMIDVCAARVVGAGESTCSKTTPDCARAAMRGVVGRVAP